MKEKVKKIIAREFLYSLSSLILFCGIFIMWNYINSNNNNSIESLNNEIELLKTEFNKPNNEYLSGLFTYLESTDSLKISEEKWLNKIKNSDLEKRRIFENLGGEKKLKAKYEIWNIRVFGEKEKNKKLENEIKILEEKNGKLNNSFFNEKIIALDLFIFFLLILFGFRYLIYATSWSIKKLKD
jgi:hypothetical protein